MEALVYKNTGDKVGETYTEFPEGWDYNPSSWSQRIPIIMLAIVGLALASYLSLFQFKWIEEVWEPFFGNGSKKILNSGLSKILPIPDAALGALGYLVDAVSGIIGGRQRWRTMPWMVIVFGFAVGPLGAISVLLVIFQPVLYDAWCTICLTTAAISIIMIGPTMDEMLASLQFIKRSKKQGFSGWKVFWGREKKWNKDYD